MTTTTAPTLLPTPAQVDRYLELCAKMEAAHPGCGPERARAWVWLCGNRLLAESVNGRPPRVGTGREALGDEWQLLVTLATDEAHGDREAGLIAAGSTAPKLRAAIYGSDPQVAYFAYVEHLNLTGLDLTASYDLARKATGFNL